MDINIIKNAANRKHLEKHLKDIDLNGLSPRRKSDVYKRMKLILNNYIPDKDFFKLTQEELENITLKLQKNLNSWYSIDSYIKTIRKFIRVNLDLESNEALPKKFKVLKSPREKSKYKMFKSVEDMITPRKAFELVKQNSTCLRDSFIFMLLIDTGLRPHELMKSKRKDIIQNDLGYWYIQVPKGTKTGFRKVRLILSIPYVQDYIGPISDKNELLLKITQRRLIDIVKKIGHVTPYLLRHSSASFFAMYLNDAEMCERYGWIPGSKQLRTYVHLSQKQLDDKINKIIKIDNGNSEENDLELLSPKFCLNCKRFNNFDKKFCSKCNLELTMEDKVKREKLDKIAYKSAEELLKITPMKFEEIANSLGVNLERNQR